MNRSEKNRITLELGNANDDNSYYVYALCEKSTSRPFYIGKGKDERLWAHEKSMDEFIKIISKEINKEIRENDLSVDEKELIERIKNDKIKKIYTLSKSDDYEPVIIKYGLTEHEAFMVESALINMYSYMYPDSLTNIANGFKSKKEKNNKRSCSTKARNLDEFLNECAPESKSFYDIKAKVLFVKINKFYPECLTEPKDNQDAAIYDSARAAWIVSKDRLNKIEYVFAIYNSKVVGIYPVNKNSWKLVGDMDETYPTFPNRNINEEKKNDRNKYYFNKANQEIPEEILQYMNCVIENDDGNDFFKGRGKANTVRYNF